MATAEAPRFSVTLASGAPMRMPRRAAGMVLVHTPSPICQQSSPRVKGFRVEIGTLEIDPSVRRPQGD